MLTRICKSKSYEKCSAGANIKAVKEISCNGKAAIIFEKRNI